jgi:hypothetical protein
MLRSSKNSTRVRVIHFDLRKKAAHEVIERSSGLALPQCSHYQPQSPELIDRLQRLEGCKVVVVRSRRQFINGAVRTLGLVI